MPEPWECLAIGLGLLLSYVIHQGSSGWAVSMEIKLLSCIQKRFTYFQWQAELVAEALQGERLPQDQLDKESRWLLDLPEVAALRRTILFLYDGEATDASYSLLG